MALALLHVYRAIHLSILKVCSVFVPAQKKQNRRPRRAGAVGSCSGLGMDPAGGGREPGDPSLPSSFLEFLLVCRAADSTITHVTFRISRRGLHCRQLISSLLTPDVSSDCDEHAFFARCRIETLKPKCSSVKTRRLKRQRYSSKLNPLSTENDLESFESFPTSNWRMNPPREVEEFSTNCCKRVRRDRGRGSWMVIG